MTDKFTPKDIDVENDTLAYDGFIKVHDLTLRHRKFDGSMTESLPRICVARRPAVAVLPYDPKRDTVLLIEQFRVGAMIGGAISPWLLEIVAGLIEPGEAPDEVARRELAEEAGVTAKSLTHLYHYYSTPGASSEQVDFYYAEVDLVDVPEFAGLDEEHEDIKIHVLPCQAVLELLESGKIQNALAILAIQWLALNRTKLRKPYE